MAKVVKVKGQVVVGDNRSRWNEPYEAEFMVGANLDSDGEYRALVRKTLIGDHLRDSVKGYRRVRTMELVSVKDAGKDAKVNESELEDLMAQCLKRDCIPDGFESYSDAEGKVAALKRALVAKDRSDSKKKAQRKKDAETGYID